MTTQTAQPTRRRLDVLDAVLRALRTGEFSAAEEAKAAFDPAIVLSSDGKELSGAEAVGDRLTGQWALTPVYAQGEWSDPVVAGNSLRVTATFPTFGTIKGYALTVTFNASDRITRLDEINEMYPAVPAVDRLPAVVRTAINGALANGTPIVVGYTGDDGAPALSLRGSTQVYGDAELCIWVRNPKSGLVEAARKGAPLSLLYRNSPRRMTLVMRGRGEIAADPYVRERIWSLSPEVEKRHDPSRKGVPILIRLERCAGNTPSGPVNFAKPV